MPFKNVFVPKNIDGIRFQSKSWFSVHFVLSPVSCISIAISWCPSSCEVGSIADRITYRITLQACEESILTPSFRFTLQAAAIMGAKGNIATYIDRTHSLGLGYKLCTVIPVAGQRTYRTTFGALKLTFRIATAGAESAVEVELTGQRKWPKRAEAYRFAVIGAIPSWIVHQRPFTHTLLHET